MADNRLKWHSGDSDFIQLADEMNEGMSKLKNSKADSDCVSKNRRLGERD